MEENKIKKKRTLSVSTRKTHNPPNYVQSGRKTSVVIEKKTTKRWVDKKFQPRNTNFNKAKTSSIFSQKNQQ